MTDSMRLKKVTITLTWARQWSLVALLGGPLAGCSGTPSTNCTVSSVAGQTGTDPCASGGGSAIGGASSTGGMANGGTTVVTGGASNTGGSSAAGATSTGGTAASCVTDTQTAPLASVNLIILLDKSGSMGNDPSGLWANAATRWNPVVQTLDAFVSDANSNRMNAALILLPANGNIDVACIATNYESGGSAVSIPLTLLDPLGRQLFLSQLCDPSVPQTPPCIVPAGGTPTCPALQGAIAYAASASQSNPNSRSVVVFLTDGEPGFGYQTSSGIVTDLYSCDDLTNGCATGGTNCTSWDQEVAKVAAVIQTAPAKSVYVVGVGDLTTGTLAQWATASGNAPISLISMSPTQAAATLSAALDSIRSNAVSCSFQIPVPAGQASADYSKINLNYVAGSGTAQPMFRASSAAACTASALGWYYDNPATPNAINLCPSACGLLQQDATAKIQVTFGCASLTL